MREGCQCLNSVQTGVGWLVTDTVVLQSSRGGVWEMGPGGAAVRAKETKSPGACAESVIFIRTEPRVQVRTRPGPPAPVQAQPQAEALGSASRAPRAARTHARTLALRDAV